MNQLLFLTLFLLAFNGSSQEYFSVIAHGGIWLRKAPNLDSLKMGKLLAGQDVLLIDKSGVIRNLWFGPRSFKG